ncbi:glycoside hydrolase family 55 protein [Chaetomium sp. MPI-CAGE-AT-0009]|nr:glycoside hydrolase family 55 protein [Chaetomium sp. MPI-CAGE-AT-0009]
MLLLLPLLTLATALVSAVEPQRQQNATGYWYENIQHNGISPTIPNGANWTVFRNVKNYGAKGDGTTDDTAAIQRAINTGDSTGTRDSGRFGSTGQPAVVYFPEGTYLVKESIKSAVGTVIMGDPTNLPTIKAAANFTGTYLLIGRDERLSGLIGFFHGVKNLVLDSTSVPPTKTISLLEWSVSQNNLLSNVVFNMPVGATSHTGVATQGMCSALIMNDLQFNGGGVGIQLSATQYHLKSLHFKDVKTGIRLVNVLQATAQGLRFEGCSVGIDASTGNTGMLNLIDSNATNTSVVVHAAASSGVPGSLVLENVIVDDSVAATIQTNTTPTLTGSVPPNTAWIRGNTYHPNSTTPLPSPGRLIRVTRPHALINTTTSSYHTLPPPTYATYPLTSVINVKTHPTHPAAGDGARDDTASLQAILDSAAAAGHVVFFPHGIYLLSDTLVVPPGSRLVGEAWTQLSATGKRFADAANPRPMVRVGGAGDKGLGRAVGVAQMSDFVLTVAEVLPGAVLMEVDMVGREAGDVGFWNCHFRVGGARGSVVRGPECERPEGCLAARLALHLREGSGSYWENVWGWTADHDLDGAEGNVYPAAAGGLLVEATRGTWMLGMGFDPEHNVLYQVNINKAENVFIGLQQGESAYWQGKGNTLLAPAPWAESLLESDPDFAWCGASDAECRMGVYQRISRSKNINIYSSGFWNFVAGPQRAMCADDCQANAALYESNEKLYVYGFSTINNRNLVLESGSGGNVTVVATRAANAGAAMDGFKTGTVAGYFRQSG